MRKAGERRGCDDDMAIADWIESTGGTCGIVPVCAVLRARSRPGPARPGRAARRERVSENREVQSCVR